jgi:hypothetical protein
MGVNLEYTLKPNGIEDGDKLRQIIESMRTNGWQGAPIVIWGDIQITGSHRAVAALETGTEAEVISFEEVFEEDGADFEGFYTEYLERNTGNVYSDLDHYVDYLSPSIINKYDIDLR